MGGAMASWALLEKDGSVAEGGMASERMRESSASFFSSQ
jgi:hypothetical protein